MKKQLICLILFLLPAFTIASGSDSAAEEDTINAIVNIGDSCLAADDYDCAKSAYVRAYSAGMSRDSLAFMIAALYMHKKSFDTALVYNFSCTTSTSLLYPSVLDQRKKLLEIRFPGLKTSAYNTSRVTSGHGENSIGLLLTGTYLKYTTNEFPFIDESKKYHESFDLNSLNSTLLLFYDQFFISRQNNYEPHHKLSVGTIVPLDDTVFTSASTKYFQLLSELSIRNRSNNRKIINTAFIQYTKKRTVYTDYLGFDFPKMYRDIYLMPRISGKVEFDRRFSLSNAKITGSLFMASVKNRKIHNSGGLSLSYNWQKNDCYYKYVQANTDSVSDGIVTDVFFDQECTKKYTGHNYTTGYWTLLESRPLVEIPGQTIDITPVFNSFIKISGILQFETSLSCYGKIFLGRVKSLAVGGRGVAFFDPDETNRNADDKVIAIFYNRSDDKFYFIENPLDKSKWILSGNNVVTIEKKDRFDATVFLQAGLRFRFPATSELYCGGYFSKTFSTLDQDLIVLPLPDYNWGISTELKMQFGIHRREKKS